MSACADKELLLQGFVDGELDAANTLTCEAHLRVCAGCAAELERLEALRAALAAPAVSYEAPPEVRARLLALLERPARSEWRARARAWIGGPLAALAGGVALAAGVALAVLVWLPSRSLQDDLVASHVRSLLASHLLDVAASDRHLVKPWFNGKLDFAPPVPDLSDAGFPLAGGRLDYIQGHTVAALVYRRRLHTINLFIWPSSEGMPRMGLGSRHAGYSLEHWSQAGLSFWAISDTDPGELGVFRAAFAARTHG